MKKIKQIKDRYLSNTCHTISQPLIVQNRQMVHMLLDLCSKVALKQRIQLNHKYPKPLYFYFYFYLFFCHNAKGCSFYEISQYKHPAFAKKNTQTTISFHFVCFYFLFDLPAITTGIMHLITADGCNTPILAIPAPNIHKIKQTFVNKFMSHQTQKKQKKITCFC